MKNNPRLLAAVLVFVGAVLFSTKAVLVKLAYRFDVDTLSLLTLRMGFALPFFIGIAVYSTRKNHRAAQPVTLSKKDWGGIAVLALLGFFVASYLDFWGLQYVSAGMERLILFIYPTLVLLLNAVIYKEKINRTQVFALLLTYFGIALAFAQGMTTEGYPHFLFGGGLICISALTYAIYLVGSGRLLPRLGTLRFTSHAMIFACSAVLLQHGILQQWKLGDFAPQVYLYAALMAFFATVLPVLLISEGIRIIGASNAAVIGSVGPVSTIVLAYFFLGEVLGFWQIIGTVIVIAGVLLISLRKGKKNSTANNQSDK